MQYVAGGLGAHKITEASRSESMSACITAGDPTEVVTEDAGMRYIHSTGQFAGTELHLLVEVRCL